MPPTSQDPRDAYDAYLATCVRGDPEEPDDFLARYPEAGTETRELVRALYREHAAGEAAKDVEGLPFERLGDYRLVRSLGEGGMGTVYLAVQESLRRTVALKVVRPELAASSTMLKRLAREAEAIARLRHPGIVSVYELGEDQGARFIAMEHVPGQPLDRILRDVEAIPVHRLFQWVAQVGRALAYAHGQGVIHRDVKPGNVLITPDDRAVLLDFGIAHITDLEATRLTQSFAGSPLYAAPEQIGSGDVDERTDVYLLGVTAYECVTGVLPFRGGTLEHVFRRVLLEDARPPSRINPSLPREADFVISKAMEKNPDARYTDMESLAADLEALSRSRPVQARAAGVPTRVRKWARRRPVRATITAALLLVALGIGAFMVNASARRASERRERAQGLVGRARGVLEGYRTARLARKENEEELQRLGNNLIHKDLSEGEEQRYESLLDDVEELAIERDLMFSQVLELLQQARALHGEVLGVDEVTARLWLERVEEARTAKNPTAARRLRAKVAEHDPDGRYTGALLQSGSVRWRTDPPGFTVYGFRREVQRDLVPGGDRRLVPVPVRAAPTPAPPGTWTLRVVHGAGTLRPHDQILELCGHPIQGAILAGGSHGEVQLGDRLVSIGARRVRLVIDGTAPSTDGPQRYVFVRAGRQIEVKWTDPPIELVPAARLAERGGVPARVYQDGSVRSMTLPPGLRVRVTAAPLFLSTACALGRTPTEKLPFEPGRYVFLLRKEGYEDLVVHERINGGYQRERMLRPNAQGSTPAGFVFVAHPNTKLDPFWIQEREVTNAEYLEFLNDPQTLAEVERARTEGRYIRFPRNDQTNSVTGGHWERKEDGTFVLPPPWIPAGPVMSLTLADAKAYAAWRSRRDGRSYVLPTVQEWRHAGVSRYPFGDVFRPRYASSLRSRRAYRGFDPVMSFPIDECVTGAYDMSGSVMEWLDWDGSRGFKGMSVGGSALRAETWEFEVFSLHPRNPDFAGGDCGFRLVVRTSDPK